MACPEVGPDSAEAKELKLCCADTEDGSMDSMEPVEITYMGAHSGSSTTISEGGVWKLEQKAVRWTPCRFSPPGVACGAEGGNGSISFYDQWSCPD